MNSTAVAKTQRKQVQRDRAAIRAEARTLSDPHSSQANKDKAINAITATVLRGTGLTTTGNSAQMLGRLTVDLLSSPGTVVGLGINDTIKLKVSAEDAASIPAQVVARLNKLV